MDLESKASRYMHLHLPLQKIKSVPAKRGAQLKTIAISALVKLETIAMKPSVVSLRYCHVHLLCSPSRRMMYISIMLSRITMSTSKVQHVARCSLRLCKSCSQLLLITCCHDPATVQSHAVGRHIPFLIAKPKQACSPPHILLIPPSHSHPTYP